MDRPLVLCIFGVFVFFLLRIERREGKKVSRASWIPTLWLLYFASKPLSSWLAPYGLVRGSGNEIETGSTVDGLFLLALIGLGFIIVANRKLDWRSTVYNNRLLIVLVAYLLISCFWSEVPDRSLKQWVRVFGSVIMAFVVLTEADPRQAFQSVLVRNVYILIPLSLVLVKYVPELGVAFGEFDGERMWQGACLQKNGLGRLCLVSAVVLVWRLTRRWKGRDRAVSRYQTPLEVLVLLITLFLLKGPSGGTFSATSLGVVVLSIAVLLALLCLQRSMARQLFEVVAAFTMVLTMALAVMAISGNTAPLGTGLFGRDATFTGRTFIWEEIRSIAWRNPILGTGYSSFWCQLHPDSVNFYNINEGHNGYLDVFLETGFLGLGLLFLVLGSYARRVQEEKTYDFDRAALGIVFLLLFVIHNFTETSFLRSSTHLWALFVFMYVMFPGDEGIKQIIKRQRGYNRHKIGSGGAPVLQYP